MDRFIEHNKHWQSPEIFAEQDPHLYALTKRHLIYEPELIYELPYFIPGIYTLSGGRQIGKTTLLKQWMKYLVMKKSGETPSIFFMTGEMISDHTSLVQLVKGYLNQQDIRLSAYTPLIIIIDEVNYIKNWDQGIKYLADSGAFENVIVILTGSDTTFIKEARMRFPGRRGMADKVDFHLYPLSLFEFVRLKHKGCYNPSPELLLAEFETSYLKHGGFLTAINDYAKNQWIELATYRTYSDWVRGDFLKRGKLESYLIEIIRAIIKTYGSTISWNGLTKHTSISHHDTVRQYVELLESMDIVFIQYALLEDKLTAAPKKDKKIIFKDPFMYHALHEWVFSDRTERSEGDALIPYLAESSVISHYNRFYTCYYIKAEGEVDLAYIYENQFFPIEIKWRKQLRSVDIKQISKYKKNGLILNQNINEGKMNDIPTRFLPGNLDSLYIRERLEEVTCGSKGIATGEQIQIIEKILGRERQQYEKHSVNCFAYALGFDKSERYMSIATNIENKITGAGYFASSSFIQYLLEKKVLKEINTQTKDCLVIYFDNKEPKHAGLVKQDSLTESYYIESKWGTFSALFSHELWDVPKSYGNKIKYYVSPSLEKVEEYFTNYCIELQKLEHETK
jgi:hypothetical protein